MAEAYRVLGIDPGITGAFALLDVDTSGLVCKLVDTRDMPTVQKTVNRKVRQRIDFERLAEQFLFPGGLKPTHIFIEEVSSAPGQGVASTFSFGYAAGALAGVAAGFGVPFRTILPKQWMAKIKLPSQDDASRLWASQHFPDKRHMFDRKKDHNRADAICIAFAGACFII